MENTITKKVKQLSRTQQGVSLTQEDREILDIKKGEIVEVRKPHSEFIKEVKEASSLPAQTRKALGPESEEDRAMYDSPKIIKPCKRGSQHKSEEGDGDMNVVSSAERTTPNRDVQRFSESERIHINNKDALCEGGEKNGK